MSVLGIDVGIRNLAICCLGVCCTKPSITFWEVIDTLNTGGDRLSCQAIMKNGKVCTKHAVFKTAKPEYFCSQHARGQKQAVRMKTRKLNVNNLTLQTIASKMLDALNVVINKHHECFNSSIKKVNIELQPRVNNKMKFISHVIFTKLLDTMYNDLGNTDVVIRFVAAKKKLRQVEKEGKDTYSKRKQKAIEHAKDWLCQNDPDWIPFIDGCKKKDDAADSLLIAIDAL